MKKRKQILMILYHVFTILLAFVFLVPIIWMVSSSFKPEAFIFKDIGTWRVLVPANFTIENYVNALNLVPLGKFTVNSLISVGLATIFGLFVNSFCGYALAKLRVPFKKLILSLIIMLIVIPFQSIIIPLYLVVNGMGLINTIPALVLPFIGSCYNIFLFRQFFMRIPTELEEAAYIDGASTLRTFISIIIPVSKESFATVAVLSFTGLWSEFLWPLMVTNDDSVRTVQLGLQYFFTEPPYSYGNIMAGLTIGTLPMVIVFLFLQKYYVKGISAGSLKG